MAVARELLGDRVSQDANLRGGSEQSGILLIFRRGLYRADEKAFRKFREGDVWRLPPSYTRSSRRNIFVDRSDMFHPIKVSLEILNEKAGSWDVWEDEGERHVLGTSLYVAGENLQLGSRVPKPWSLGKETLILRQVLISYDPETFEPKVIVKDKIPRKGAHEEMRYCNSDGVLIDQPGEYLSLGSSESRPMMR